MIINALILVILITCLLIRRDKRSAFIIFIVPAALFQAANAVDIIPYDYFYLMAGCLDAAVVVMLVKWARAGVIAFVLGLISVASVFSNMLGWMAYERDFDPVVYDMVFVGIYVVTLLAALMEWYGGARADSHDMRIRSSWI